MVVVVVHTAAQHRVVDGWRRPVRSLCRGPVDVFLPLTAQDLPEGGAHLLVTVGVNDGVHGRVELGKKQEELFIVKDVAAGTEDVKKEDDQAGGPADDECTWGENKAERKKKLKIKDVFQEDSSIECFYNMCTEKFCGVQLLMGEEASECAKSLLVLFIGYASCWSLTFNIHPWCFFSAYIFH